MAASPKSFAASTERSSRSSSSSTPRRPMTSAVCVAGAIVENLCKHAALEEMTVYPEVEHDVGHDEADALRDEHQQLKERCLP
jgi:hypothetical protein